MDGVYAHLLSIAPAAGRVEVGQLETRREKVLKGMQDGARRCSVYDDYFNDDICSY